MYTAVYSSNCGPEMRSLRSSQNPPYFHTWPSVLGDWQRVDPLWARIPEIALMRASWDGMSVRKTSLCLLRSQRNMWYHARRILLRPSRTGQVFIWIASFNPPYG